MVIRKYIILRKTTEKILLTSSLTTCLRIVGRITINLEIYDRTSRVQQMVNIVIEPACTFNFYVQQNKCFSGIDKENIKLMFCTHEYQQ